MNFSIDSAKVLTTTLKWTRPTWGFTQKIQNLLNRQTITTTRRWHPMNNWITPELLQSRAALNKLQFKATTTPQNVENYKEFRRVYQRTIRTAKNLYYEIQLEIHSKNGKKVWQIIGEITERTKCCEAKLPTSIVINGTRHTNALDVSDILNEYFVSVSRLLSPVSGGQCPIQAESFGHAFLEEYFPTSCIQVKEILQLKPKSSTGQEDLSSY